MRCWFISLLFYLLPLLLQAHFDDDIQQAWQLIEKNASHASILKVEQLENTPITPKQKIQCLEVKKWAYFFNQEFTAFHMASRQQHALLNPDPSSSQEAMYLAEQAYFFHYLTWQDSVIQYITPCKKIIQNAPLDLPQFNKAFIYAMLANGELYVNHYDQPLNEVKYKRIDQYFTQAIAALSTPSPFNLRIRSAIMRSWGSRTLDRISNYHYLSPQEVKARPKPIQALDNLAHRRYLEAAACAPPECVEDQVAALSLCGLMHSYLAEYDEANAIFQDAMLRIEKRYGSLANCPQAKIICLLVKYKLANDEKHTGFIDDADGYIQKLSALQPIYNGLTRSFNQFRHDTYHSSPTQILACILLQKAKQKQDKSLFQLGASYFIENQELEFMNTPNTRDGQQLRQFLATREQSPTKKIPWPPIIQSSVIPSKLVQNIQKKLDDQEIVVCTNSPTALMNNHVLVISNESIDWIKTTEFHESESFRVGSEYEPLLYKKYHYAMYQAKLAPIVQQFPKAKKYHVMYNDNIPYEQLVDSPEGSGFHEMHFVFKKIQFNRIYQVKRYFNQKPKSLEKKINLFSLVQPQFKTLYFTLDMIKGLFRQSFDTQFSDTMTLMQSVEQPVITHLYGHGTADSSEHGFFKYAIPYFDNTHWQQLHNLQTSIPKSHSLVIFNTCFSGATNYMLNYDSNLYPFLLHQGAPAVIISTTHSEDQASSEIFASFYEYLEEGKNAEDAFYMAKKDYLQKQQGDNCNPLRWNAYRMISSQKIIPFTPLTWWEKVWNWISNWQYLFAPPDVK